MPASAEKPRITPSSSTTSPGVTVIGDSPPPVSLTQILRSAETRSQNPSSAGTASTVNERTVTGRPSNVGSPPGGSGGTTCSPTRNGRSLGDGGGGGGGDVV